MWLNKLYTTGYELLRHFHTYLICFWAQKFLSCKTAYAIIKVVYQASQIPKIRKIWCQVAEKCSKKHIFQSFFAILGQNCFFSSKIRLYQFLVTTKSYLDTKNQKKTNALCLSANFRTDKRTGGRKSANLNNPSQILWVGPKMRRNWNFTKT